MSTDGGGIWYFSLGYGDVFGEVLVVLGLDGGAGRVCGMCFASRFLECDLGCFHPKIIRTPIVKRTGTVSASHMKASKYKCPIKLRYKLQENAHIMGTTF